MKRLTLIALLALAGCAKDPVAVAGTDNPKVNVDTLFQHDGCTVYRFYDTGQYRYFAKCKTPVTVEWTESCGKGCTRDVEIPTVVEGQL